jgi:hypothetical protein
MKKDNFEFSKKTAYIVITLALLLAFLGDNIFNKLFNF